MIAMNARAELQSVPFDVIARDFLASAGKTGSAQPQETRRGFTAKLFGPDLWQLTRQHLLLVAVSVGVAILIGVPLAILVFPHVQLRAVVLGFASILQTVPSLALLAVLISMLGAIGTAPALIALTLYSLLPIMRNTVTGLSEVPNGLRLAGTALGMTPPQSLQLVLLPLALPTLLAGVRTATAIAIGTATIAAFIGAGGFGERIVTGLALNDRELLVAGALPAAALALLSEGIFELVEFLMRRHRRAPPSSLAP
jgi:osmoprotectant transport system permease protein